MDNREIVRSFVAAEGALTRRWTVRFEGTDGAPRVATELLQATIAGLDLDREQSSLAIADPARALGVFRAQSGYSATALVEDVLSLRSLLWGHIAALPRTGDDLALLLLLQDHLTTVLDGAVRDAVAAFVDESTRVLAAQATRDVLTGIANRAEFQSVLDREIATADRSGPPSLLMMDLDGFKGVNDTLGHLTGDQVLIHIAEVLTAVCRPGDVPCRLGGDEFTVILPRTDRAGAEKFAGRILKAVRKERYLSDLSARVGTSIGIGHLAAPTSVEQLVGIADAALYKAKRAGGHQFVTATEIDLADLADAS